MSVIGQVRSSAYLPFVQFMDETGGSRAPELDKLLVPAIAQGDPEALIPAYLAHSYLERSARAVGLQDLGFVVGRQARVDSLGAFGRSLGRSLTLHDAFGKLRSNFGFYSSAERIWWSRAGQSVRLCHAYTIETGVGSRHAQQCALLLLRDLVRLAAGPTWQPVEVFSTNPDLDAKAMQEAFEGAHVRHSEFVGFEFPVRLLSMPFGWRRPGGMRQVAGDPTAFEVSAPAGDFVGSIKQVIATLMSHGKCEVGEIAGAVGMHPRTLQRRLSDAQREYSEVLAEVRFETALRLLNVPDLQVIQIAYELGYTDPANFTRAFRHWTGVSPTKFRRMWRDRQQTTSLA